jgi:hypothetical protein
MNQTEPPLPAPIRLSGNCLLCRPQDIDAYLQRLADQGAA